MKRKQESGFIFLEIVIATALVGIVLTTLLGMGLLVLNLSYALSQSTRANSLVRGEFEAIRSFRDGDTWSDFTNVNFGGNNNYYFALSGTNWIRNTGTETIGSFTRKVVFDQVYRDGSGNIAASGTLDAQTVKATVTVSWSSKTMQVVTYYTNWQNK